MIAAESEPVIVFNHIPKCYGTSLRKWFRQFMTPHADYQATFERDEDFARYPYETSTFGAEDILLGHFNGRGNNLEDRYPEVLCNPRFRLFTFVREPLEMQISLYYYTLKKKPQVVESKPERFDTLEGYLRLTLNSMASCFPCTAENMMEVLSRYFFLGVADRVGESMSVLVDELAEIFQGAETTRSVRRVVYSLETMKRRLLPHENKAARDGQAALISDETREIFRSRNALDYAIYEYANKRLDEVLDRRMEAAR